MSSENFNDVTKRRVNHKSSERKYDNRRNYNGQQTQHQGEHRQGEHQQSQYQGQRNFNRVVVRATQTRRKSSRTLLLKDVGQVDFKYDGILQVEKSPQGNVFLVFDTLENSRKAFKDLRINKVNCKYSYYKLFFKSTNLDTNKSYDELKASFLKLLGDNVNGLNVLYFKYYRKDGKFTGSGDFVVDRKVDCDAIVKARTLKLEESEFTYYRYRTNRLQTGQHTQHGSEGNNSEEEVQ